MLKILTTKQLRELDTHTIEHEPISSIDLMERACRAFVSWFIQHFDIATKVGIVCGTGNNGGDGLGIARMLHESGYSIKVWIVHGSVPESQDFKLNLHRMKGIEVFEISTSSDQGLFADRDLLIDAIFGSGLSRPPEGIYAQAIRCINNTEATRVAVDIPSGLSADQLSSGEIVCAHYTVSFHLPKLSFMFPHSHPFVGEWTTVDIGLNRSYIRQAETDHFYITSGDARKILKPRAKFDHKGVYGHALIVAGSHGKMGAAVLATRAALRSGTGIVTAHAPKCGYVILQTSIPEAMVSVDKDEEQFSDLPALESFSAIAAGPGLGQSTATVNAFGRLLKTFRKPIVIDADGLNMLAAHKELQELVPENSILTPHPKEFERLVGKWSGDFERLEKQKQLAARLKSVIVLKGANTSTVSPSGKAYFNSTGNPGMATGGAGDVLTGILAGLLAQDYAPLDAAILGVYLHGLAGDVAVYEKGRSGLIASDIVESIPHSFLKLFTTKF